jgi:HD-GYP domain-containing protein (c-di-GMP phosphodiesterase class II)
MRFRTRAFLLCFIPFALLLSVSFWMVQRFVQSTVREGLRTSLRENQLAIARIHAKNDLQNNRFLKVAGENPSLKAGIELLRSHPDSPTARRTVEDQLRELGEHMGFDYLLISTSNGAPLAGVARGGISKSRNAGELIPLDPIGLSANQHGLLLVNGRAFQSASVPIDQGSENLGSLTVGELFDLSEFTIPAVLMHDGRIIASNIVDTPTSEIESALRACDPALECAVRLRDANWISLPMQSFGGADLLRGLQNTDQVAAPVQARLRSLFFLVALVSVLFTLIGSIVTARSIGKPIAALVSHLRKATRTGVLPEFRADPSSVTEIHDLATAYNRAARTVRTANEDLNAAYLEFVGSLANALDARDRYTAGHSWRVSQISCLVASSMKLPSEQIERVRVGALLHDIGKIGIADSVLQKRGMLTEEQFAIVKEHPVIGRRILEGVQGLAPFLDAVELHHENWDGTGYPKGQRGEETAIDARIIHVSDAYDAMTTDRSYRRGMTHDEAIQILREHSARQYDPLIVEHLISIPSELLTSLVSRSDQKDDRIEFSEVHTA